MQYPEPMNFVVVSFLQNHALKECQAQDSNPKEYHQQGEECQELNRTVDASEPFHFSIEKEKEYSPCITDGQ
jgi:hypothetical protein